ncbi:hypothetical protein KK001_16325, partial [Enterobacter roggenkampii]|nr:hypothetical protein [Enterobacter roggenkampii]
VCGKKIGPDPRNFNQRVSLGRNDLLIRTFPKPTTIKEYLCIIIECGQAYAPLAPLVLKALAEKIASKLKSRQIVKYLISKEF